MGPTSTIRQLFQGDHTTEHSGNFKCCVRDLKKNVRPHGALRCKHGTRPHLLVAHLSPRNVHAKSFMKNPEQKYRPKKWSQKSQPPGAHENEPSVGGWSGGAQAHLGRATRPVEMWWVRATRPILLCLQGGPFLAVVGAAGVQLVRTTALGIPPSVFQVGYHVR